MAEPTDVRVVSEERRAYLAQKKREQRAKAKAQGKCTVCARNPADPGLVSCKACRENIVGTMTQPPNKDGSRAITRAIEHRWLIPEQDVMRFRVVLKDVEPTIWRVFDVPANATLPVLSATILAAMGWKDYHLHQFRCGRLRFSLPDPDELDVRIIDERRIGIAAIFHVRGDECEYQYDFGDWWEHAVQMTDFFSREKGVKYPLLVDGARACPPEDFGGPHAYVEAFQSGSWPARFDPEAFNFTAARNRVKKVPLRPLYRWR